MVPSKRAGTHQGCLVSLPSCEVWLGDRDTGTQLDDVQSVNFSVGRAKLTDNYRAGTGVITGRNPGSLPTINIGDDILIFAIAEDTYAVEYLFTVADIRFDYGINSEQDTWTITIENVLARLGRTNIDISWPAGTLVSTAISDVGVAAGLIINAYTTTHALSAQNLTNVNALQVLQTLANTDQGLFQVTLNRLIYYPNRRVAVASGDRLTCSDTATGAEAKYDKLVFAGVADTFVEQVIASGDGLNDAVAGSGPFNFQYSTYQETQSELQSNAEYMLGALSVQTSKPTQVSININANSTTAKAAIQGLFQRDNVQRIDLEVRGSTYQTVVLGWQFSAVPGSMRYTMDLASTDFFAFLILDDATFGRLDFNKLGF